VGKDRDRWYLKVAVPGLAQMQLPNGQLPSGGSTLYICEEPTFQVGPSPLRYGKRGYYRS